MLRSLRTAARLFEGEVLSFREKLEGLVGVPAAPISDDDLSAMHGQLEALLGQAGLQHGSLSERVHRWEAERTVDSGELEPDL